MLQVAFLARLSEHFGPIEESAHLIFPQVDTNVGSGYDPASGSFLVTIDGVYAFHLHVMAVSNYIAWLAIKVRGDITCYRHIIHIIDIDI